MDYLKLKARELVELVVSNKAGKWDMEADKEIFRRLQADSSCNEWGELLIVLVERIMIVARGADRKSVLSSSHEIDDVVGALTERLLTTDAWKEYDFKVPFIGWLAGTKGIVHSVVKQVTNSRGKTSWESEEPVQIILSEVLVSQSGGSIGLPASGSPNDEPEADSFERPLGFSKMEGGSGGRGEESADLEGGAGGASDESGDDERPSEAKKIDGASCAEVGRVLRDHRRKIASLRVAQEMRDAETAKRAVSSLERKEQMWLYRAFFHKLKIAHPDWADALTLSFCEVSAKEIAERLRTTENNVAQMKHRATEFLIAEGRAFMRKEAQLTVRDK